MQFDYMYHSTYETIRGFKLNPATMPAIINIIIGWFKNCRPMKYVTRKRMEKNPDPRRDRFEKKLEWYSMFGDYYHQRWQIEMESLLNK